MTKMICVPYGGVTTITMDAYSRKNAHSATTCGRIFEINVGLPSENGMKFCCYCGKPLVEKLYTEND